MNAPHRSPLGTEHSFASLDWISEQFGDLPLEREIMTPSRWAELNRYLPAGTTPVPGYWSWEVNPFMREILDCMDPLSPVQEIDILKGAQVTYTVSVLENYIGYSIAYEQNQPLMLLTSTDQLAAVRVDVNILQMIDNSKLGDRVRSHDAKSRHKQGRTKDKIEWQGGGYLLPRGAKSPTKYRSVTVGRILCDEVDSYEVTKDGDPLALANTRTSTYGALRKNLRGSTPTLTSTSLIYPGYLLGDQREYEVPCLKCGGMQALRWRDEHEGHRYGIVFETDDHGHLIEGTVFYVCKFCEHRHTNNDKTKMLRAGKWVPTNPYPDSPYHRSYHVPALLSPVGMYSWEDCVRDWLKAWDPAKNLCRDVGKLQTFYNNVLGRPFDDHVDKVELRDVISHRSQYYRKETVPNMLAERCAGSRIQLLTAGVDVHKNTIFVGVFGWTSRRTVFLVDYFRITGTGENCNADPNCAETYGVLRDWINDKRYLSDDGKEYPVERVFIDSGYQTDAVVSFVSTIDEGIAFPIKGVDSPARGSFVEFQRTTTKLGTTAFNIHVDRYKDRWAASLKHDWDRQGSMPDGYFVAPDDLTDEEFRELTKETRKEVRVSGRVVGYKWVRPGGAANELWDCLIYATASLESVAISFFELYGAKEKSLGNPYANKAHELLKGHESRYQAFDWEIFWEICEHPDVRAFWSDATWRATNNTSLNGSS